VPQLLKRLGTIAERRRKARQELEQVIKEVSAKGASVSDIANAIGMSRQRVYQILEKEENVNGQITRASR
jgi:DNA invertase Pin-like site-specific DNA recombinase